MTDGDDGRNGDSAGAVARALLARPDLWWTAMGVLWHLTPSRWWRAGSHLPLPHRVVALPDGHRVRAP